MGDGYGNGFSIERLAEAVSLMKYPEVDWNHVVMSGSR